ncbi:MAG: ABC transporter ATP-binding protein [Alphaproteobacteria bacterium]
MSDLKGHISAKSLTKTFGASVAVAGVDFSIPAGSYCCLLGPSGCGKTTTLRMISGHDTQSSGTIAIDDQDLGIIPPAQRPTAMMFQNYALFPHMTVEDNVAFSLRVKGANKTVRRQRAAHLLEVVELSDYAQRKPNELSGGQQQRVALARALMMNPSVLALDEPLSALDPFLRLKVRSELKALQRRLGITFLHVTHSQTEALALADQIILMNNGALEQVGTAEDLYHRPATAFAAQFMGVQNVFRAHGLEASTDIQLFSADEPAAKGPLYRAPIDAFEFSALESGAAGPKIDARVSAVEYAGDHLALTVETMSSDVGLKVEMSLAAAADHPPVFDQIGTLTIKPESLVELSQ